MRLDAFKVSEHVPDLTPGKVRRDWMDEGHDRHAYRCLPLNMANVSGWDLRLKHGFDATWTGGDQAADITLTPHDEDTDMSFVATSHFANGILTFHTHYLFRTPNGWATWAMSPPNTMKDGIDALTGLIETDWLPYPFTMNWKFTRPGTVSFSKGEAFCFITLVRPSVLERIEPKIMDIQDDERLQSEYEEWKFARSSFNTRIEAQDPKAIREAWQKYYMRGEKPKGGKIGAKHTNRRRLAPPKAVKPKSK